MMLPKPLFKCNANSSTLPYRRSLTGQEAETTMEHHIRHSSLTPSQPPEGCGNSCSQASGHITLPGSP